MATKTKIKDLASKLFLFPRQYMLIGKIISVIAIIGLFFKSSNFGVTLAGEANRYDATHLTLYILLITGLFIMAWTREPEEDEFSIRLRLLSMGTAFLLGILIVAGVPLTIIISGGKAYHLNATYVVIGMLIIYHICFYLLKEYYREV